MPVPTSRSRPTGASGGPARVEKLGHGRRQDRRPPARVSRGEPVVTFGLVGHPGMVPRRRPTPARGDRSRGALDAGLALAGERRGRWPGRGVPPAASPAAARRDRDEGHEPDDQQDRQPHDREPDPGRRQALEHGDQAGRGFVDDGAPDPSPCCATSTATTGTLNWTVSVAYAARSLRSLSCAVSVSISPRVWVSWPGPRGRR